MSAFHTVTICVTEGVGPPPGTTERTRTLKVDAPGLEFKFEGTVLKRDATGWAVLVDLGLGTLQKLLMKGGAA